MKQESELYKMAQANKTLKDAYFNFLDEVLEVVENNPDLPRQIENLIAEHTGETN